MKFELPGEVINDTSAGVRAPDFLILWIDSTWESDLI